MIVYLNGYAINDPLVNRVYLDAIDGLGLPTIRTSSDQNSGRDGGYVSAQFYGPRRVSLTGRVFSSDVVEYEQTRRDLQAALQGFTVDLRLLTTAGKSYQLSCNVISFDLPMDRRNFSTDFKLELVAPDPVIYEYTSGTELSAPLFKLVSGGYTFPVTYPYTYAPSTQPTSINNTGLVPVKPRIELTGVMTNPRVLNRLTGLLVQLNDLVTGPDDLVVIDMYESTVTLNGTTIFYKRDTQTTTFWSLLPGENLVELSTIGSGDTVTGVVKWRPGVMGI